MFVLGNLLGGITWILDTVIGIYTIIIIVNALLTWVRPDPYNPIVRTLALLSDFVLDPIRRIVPMHGIGIDISPIIAILLLQFTKMFLVGSLRDLALRL